ncbi:MAG: hypothetical protein ACXVBE_13055, partial [Bdellovibrionota bacterium]
NKILFTGMKPRPSQIRYVESEVESWISREQSVLMPGRAEYFVRIESEEGFSYYHCFVEVEFGSYRLSALEGGRTLSGALTNALRRMRVANKPKSRQKFMEAKPVIHSVA